jgi:hypothetical protein
MHKKELVKTLRFRADCGEIRWKGQKSFALFLADYLERLNIPYDEKYEHWEIDHHLPELLVAAFETLRTGNEKWVVYHRKMYEQDAGYKVPNITDLSGDGMRVMLNRSSAVQTIGFLLKDILGEGWIQNEIDKYCNAQVYVLNQTFDKFLRLVYWRGLEQIVGRCMRAGMSGKFGETNLRTLVTAGRIMFTFARSKNGDEDANNEWSVSFVGEEGDPLCLSSGLQSTCADFRTSLDLIEEVIKNWPENPQDQENIFRVDDKVGLG